MISSSDSSVTPHVDTAFDVDTVVLPRRSTHVQAYERVVTSNDVAGTTRLIRTHRAPRRSVGYIVLALIGVVIIAATIALLGVLVGVVISRG